MFRAEPGRRMEVRSGSKSSDRVDHLAHGGAHAHDHGARDDGMPDAELFESVLVEESADVPDVESMPRVRLEARALELTRRVADAFDLSIDAPDVVRVRVGSGVDLHDLRSRRGGGGDDVRIRIEEQADRDSDPVEPRAGVLDLARVSLEV